MSGVKSERGGDPTPFVPAKAGIQKRRLLSRCKEPDSRFRGNERSRFGWVAEQLDGGDSARAQRRSQAAAAGGYRVGTAQGRPQLARLLVHAAGGSVPGLVFGLSARPRHLDVLYRRAHRSPRRLRWGGELR